MDVIWLDLELAKPLKYRLSTFFLLITIISVSLCWYLDHTNRNRRDIIGSWYYPTPDVNQLGYTTTLEIRSDGTFTKTQQYRTSAYIYDGTFLPNDDGTVTFHIAKRTDNFFMSEMLPEDEPTITEFDHTIRCRCAVDKTGYLLIEDYGKAQWTKETEIQWETYMPKIAR